MIRSGDQKRLHRRYVRRWLVFLASTVATCSGQAQQNPTAGSSAPAPIATDRPSTTASSIVVPLGSLQLENGFADTANQGQSTFDGPETLMRFGLLSKTELRLTVPNYFSQSVTGMENISGFGDVAIGVKQQLGPAHGFDVSLIANLSLPTGGHAFSSHGYDPSLQLPWSRSLSPNWTVAGMLSTYWPTQPTPTGDRHNFTGETTVLIDRSFGKGVDGFVEYQGDFPERGGPRNLVNFGATWKVTPRQQLDFHAGVGLSSAAPDHYFGFGYSFRLQVRHR
jgi:hypothetical protein